MAKDQFKVGDRVLVSPDGTKEREGVITEIRRGSLYHSNPSTLIYFVTTQDVVRRGICFADEMKKILPEVNSGVDSAGVQRTP